MQSFNSGWFREGCFRCIPSVWSWLRCWWFSVAAFVLLLNYKFIWFYHYRFTVTLIHVHLTYANSTVSVCWNIISLFFFFYFSCNIPLNTGQTHFFWVSTKETAVCSKSAGKAGSIGLRGENAVLGKPHVLYCVVYLNNFQGSFYHSLSLDFRSQTFCESWCHAVCCEIFDQIYRM